MTSSDLGWSIAFAVVALGLLFFWRISWFGVETIHSSLWQKIKTDFRIAFSLRTPPREPYQLDTFETFFLGGKKVGGELTGQTYWSLCFAFANAIWYFAYLGYMYGPWTFLLQVPWTLAIIVMSRFVLQYLAASKSGTVHGFIGSSYGARTAVLAAVATCLGYVLNCGFEIFYSVHLLSLAFGFKAFELIAAISLAFFVTACIVAGGYSANVRTDFWKNIFGIVGVILLLAFLFPSYSERFSTLADALTVPWTTASYNKIPPWHFMVGIAVFAFFFNFVDMANWQSLAANQDVSPEEMRRVETDLVWSALKQLLAPAFLGACLGIMLHVINPSMKDEEYFKVAFESAFPNLTPLGGLAIGFILLGLLSATISSVDNYLLAAMQTLAVDVFKRNAIAKMINSSASVRRLEEREILFWCKRYMPLLASFMVLVFGALYYVDPDRVFAYQFVMYGAAVTLFPIVIGAFRAANLGASAPSDHSGRPISSSWAFLSILCGLIVVFGAFFGRGWLQPWIQSKTTLDISADAITNLTPLLGLVAATVIYWIGVAHRRSRKAQ